MNYTLVIMGVILVIIVYILYKVIDEKGRTISGKMDLSKGASAVNVKNTGKADSTRYYIGAWLYVNKVTTDTNIFKINQGTDDFLTLQLTSSAILKYIAKTDSGTATHVIMDNFPLQKWVYVVISVDNNVVDLYIDGKLIRSHKVDGISQVSESSDIIFDQLDAFIAKMEREPKPMDPSYAWSKYMEGNGGNYFSRMLANYGGTLTLTKNDMDVREFQLF